MEPPLRKSFFTHAELQNKHSGDRKRQGEAPSEPRSSGHCAPHLNAACRRELNIPIHHPARTIARRCPKSFPPPPAPAPAPSSTPQSSKTAPSAENTTSSSSAP